MSGPAPKPTRRRANAPTRGDWTSTPERGWQHGEIPDPLVPVGPVALHAWQMWMTSWFAAHWSVDDLPGLSVVIGLYDQVVEYLREPMIEKEYLTTKGETRTTWVPRPNPASELRQAMDGYGITPKGQQDRRWAPAAADKPPEQTTGGTKPSKYDHLRTVG